MEAVDLSGCHQVTDAGVKDLAAVKSLKTLDLSGTKVSAAGLKELAALPNLTLLLVANTPVTAAEAKELKKALPKCEIHR